MCKARPVGYSERVLNTMASCFSSPRSFFFDVLSLGTFHSIVYLVLALHLVLARLVLRHRAAPQNKARVINLHILIIGKTIWITQFVWESEKGIYHRSRASHSDKNERHQSDTRRARPHLTWLHHDMRPSIRSTPRRIFKRPGDPFTESER